MRVLRASLLYFVSVFAIGFALGIIRVTLLVPWLGVRSAELMELPFMVVASYLVARIIVLRVGPFSMGECAGIGVLALALLVSAELGLTVATGGSVSGYIAGRDPISGTAYLASLLLFALMPVVARRG